MARSGILLAGRFDAFEKQGGDTVQMLETAAALVRRGRVARVTTELEPQLGGVELMHLFNWTRIGETAHRLALARRAGVPCVVTPIHQELAEYDARGRRGIGRWAARWLGREGLEQARVVVHATRNPAMRRVAARQLAGGYGALQRQVLVGCRAVIFASEGERRALEATGAEPVLARVVPLGISPEFRDATPQTWHARHPARDFVLCAARVEDLKNQLALLEALHGISVPVVFAGDLNPSHRAYGRDFVRAVAARPDTFHLPALDRPSLASAMAAARVHALPSWAENVGLASLEAAAAGAAVVSTDRGHLREYLGDQARYCDPGDLGSIRRAVLAALEDGRKEALRGPTAARFSWDHTAELLDSLYEQVLGVVA
ncbi:MAG: glycosyltransferase [Candidatus Wallbacteria bacterium]|nr:glycosyltransferase [Candidatus Wallbacteria bacterium]